jgi:hypothetical protein
MNSKAARTATSVSRGAACATCERYVALADDERLEGVCRRFPPTPFLLASAEVKMQFPVVRADMACGEFRRRRASAEPDQLPHERTTQRSKGLRS